MSDFKKVGYEGGAEVKPKNNAKYRAKCNFDTPRNPRFNKHHLFCSRVICVLLCIVNLIINIPIMMSNASNPGYALAFYSLWGTTSAFLAHIFSIAACY